MRNVGEGLVLNVLNLAHCGVGNDAGVTMFKRFQARPLVLTVALFLGGSTIASADPLPPIQEAPDPVISALDILGTSPLGPLDFDPTGLIVTDADLANAGVLLVPQVLVDPTHYVVDDDGVQCPNADFSTINAAVAASLPYGRIRVCPGEYRESVNIITPGLVLQAPIQQGQATECKTATVPDPTKQAVLLYNAAINGGNPSVGFNLLAPDVVIDGFFIQPNPAFVTQDGVGVFTSPNFSGYDVRHNVFQRNSRGVYFNSSGIDSGGDPKSSFVRENCFRNNTLQGPAGGNDVYSDQGLHLATIGNNFMTGSFNAVVVDTFLTTPSDVQIVHNESINDGAFVVFNSTRMTVSYNKVLNSAGSGVFLFNVTRSDVSFNNLQTGNNNGISLTFSSNDNLVKSNKTTGFRGNGVRLGSNSSNNAVETNRSENNGMAGMRLTTGASNNTVRNNHMRGNGTDCVDETTGPNNPPAFVANPWINDMGETQNRPGLCKHASP